jgi:CrcB protein
VIAWVAMAAIGSVGALLRHRIGLRWSAPGILVVNLSGTFVLGVLTGAAVHGAALMILGTGFCGAYTTFSTWMVERRYLAVAVAGGLAFGALGWWVGSLF